MHRIRFTVYDPTTGRRLTRGSRELTAMLKTACEHGSVSGYPTSGWVMYDGRVRIESGSAQSIRMAYNGVRNYAINCGWSVQFEFTASAATACQCSRVVRLDTIHNGFGSTTIRTTSL